ncbi:MAG: hypothetical protein ACOC0N_00065 [Chroococcales cyanobacterium]
MLEKLLLAATVTFSLYLFLGLNSSYPSNRVIVGDTTPETPNRTIVSLNPKK